MGCQSIDPGTKLPLTLHRRSVLDQIPRMLTMRFGDHHYLAYDLKNVKPVQVWHGGVLWNGAVFNSIKTVQPSSYGNVYEAFDPKYWALREGDSDVVFTAQFNSYELSGESIQFKYTLSSNRGEIEIVESPELVDLGDSILFRQAYEIRGLQRNLLLLAGGQSVRHDSEIERIYQITPLPKKPDEIASGNGAQYWLDKSGCSTCHNAQEKMIGPSYESIANRYKNDQTALSMLVDRIKSGSTGEWGTAQMIPHPQLATKDISNMVKYILSLHNEQGSAERLGKKRVVARADLRPGFGVALEGVHPAYDLIRIRPDDFRPGVGGMAFDSDGNLLISTWDSIGSIYSVSGLEMDHPDSVKVRRIASGLAEPLGLTTVNEDIYVLQKQELTQLLDHDNDGIADEYVCINNQFGVTTDFHEFSYGLVYKDGRFYGGLGLAMRLMSSEEQLPDRGTVFSVSNQSDLQIIARGFRQTNGIGVGPEGDIFVTENQGQWVPGCKFIHVKSGSFYGCQHGTGERFSREPATPPAVWLPQDEIGNSPGEPIIIRDGPYRGQMIHGDVTHGGIKRVYLEKRKGEYQGCVFRFSQGLEAGINRLVYGPDGALYAGGVGMNGGWSYKDLRFGLQKLKYNNNVPFEVLSISLKSDGFKVQFTSPIGKDIQFDQRKLKVQQWYYQATSQYGGPKLGLEDLAINAISISDDRTIIHLEIDGLKKGYVIYFLLDQDLKNEAGQELWSGEAWYTLNNF